MTQQELLDDLRLLLDDTAEPYLWSDATLVGLYNNAVDEACLRMRVIQDSTSSVCSVTLVAGQATYTLDPAIFAVRRARIAGIHDVLELTTARHLDSEESGWDDSSLRGQNQPLYAVFDYQQGTITLFPIPSSSYADTTLHLTVWRRPVEDERLEADDPEGEPAIPEHAHRELKHFAAAEAWMNADAEQHQPQRAAQHYGLFDERVGPKPTAATIQSWSVNRRRKTVAHFV